MQVLMFLVCSRTNPDRSFGRRVSVERILKENFSTTAITVITPYGEYVVFMCE